MYKSIHQKMNNLVFLIIFQGDTGSPLITRMRTGVMEHIGIASFVSGNGCETTEPSGFTRTHPYVDWLTDITNIRNETAPY